MPPIVYITLIALALYVLVYYLIHKIRKPLGLIAGGICCAMALTIPTKQNLKEQINNASYNYEEFCRGTQLMLWGLIEIITIGLRAKCYVDGVVELGGIGFIYIVGLLVMFAIEMYMIIDGVANLGRGFAQCLGIHIDRNFIVRWFKRYGVLKGLLLDLLVYFFMLVARLGGPIGTISILGTAKSTILEPLVYDTITHQLVDLGLEVADYKLFVIMCLLLALVFLLHIRGKSLRTIIEKRNIVLRWITYFIGIFLVVVFGFYGVTF